LSFAFLRHVYNKATRRPRKRPRLELEDWKCVHDVLRKRTVESSNNSVTDWCFPFLLPPTKCMSKLSAFWFRVVRRNFRRGIPSTWMAKKEENPIIFSVICIWVWYASTAHGFLSYLKVCPRNTRSMSVLWNGNREILFQSWWMCIDGTLWCTVTYCQPSL
jgi:hypothetical protein